MASSLEITDLPYDVLEVILSFLDGHSILSASQVCKDWHYWYKVFTNSRQDFWKGVCHMELSRRQLQYAYSGKVEENWLSVYKAARLDGRSINAGIIEKLLIHLFPRFMRQRAGVHFLGDKLVLVDGPMIRLYDAVTGCYLTTRFAGSFNIHHSYVIKKNTDVMLGTPGFPCDILIVLCGGNNVSHISASTEQDLLTADPQLLPSSDCFSYSSSACAVNKHHISIPPLCIAIELLNDDKVKLYKRECSGSRRCKWSTEGESESNRRHSIKLNDELSLAVGTRKGEREEFVIFSKKKKEAYKRIHVEGKLVGEDNIGYDRCDVAGKVIHHEGEVTTMIAAVMRGKESGKHLVLCRL